ncbi:hypothetical protein [Novosphingobium sp. BL-52-GroH]|uniref:hypothetical protein n=1 Tax=Novosphingobium sp. BL-52-GroH TaxID=3349877 RepID=UPI00384EE540
MVFFKSVLGTHVLGFLYLQEAARRFTAPPVWVEAACIKLTKTKAMTDRQMLLSMRLMGKFGACPEDAAVNAIRLLTSRTPEVPSGSIVRNPGKSSPNR